MAEKPTDEEDPDERFNSGDEEVVFRFFPIYLKVAFLLFLPYESFVRCLSKLNEVLNLLIRNEPHSIQFNILPYSAPYVLWKYFMIIECKRISKADQKVLKTTKLSYSEFLSLLYSIGQQFLAFDGTLSETVHTSLKSPTTSAESTVKQCCVCLDRQSNLVLSCGHRFCPECFQRWSPQETASASLSSLTSQIEQDAHSDFTLIELPDAYHIQQALIQSILSLPDSFEAKKPEEEEKK